MRFTGKQKLRTPSIACVVAYVKTRKRSTPRSHQHRAAVETSMLTSICNYRKEQLVYPPWFLSQCQQVWNLGNLSSVFRVEFVVLLMRVCSYTTQFLPSPSHPINQIRRMYLSDISTLCDDIAEQLADTCAQLDARGSLLRVQHLAFLGLRLQYQGKNIAFWDALSKAVVVAQRVGLHQNHTVLMPEMHELEKEMRRRVFCNLYIWDRYELLLSLARIAPCISYCSDMIAPQYALATTGSHSISPSYLRS